MTMAFFKPIIVVFMFFILFDSHADCTDSSATSSNEDASSIPMIASGKRMHNIMRFGKRPAGGHSLIHFGKRENTKPQHSFLYFGKRSDYPSHLPDLLQYFPNGLDGSNKRGHSIMRFGKRDPGSNNLVEGLEDEDGYEGLLPNDDSADEDKRGGHSMMYFGKRGGHNMMYFGKRGGHSMMYFGKRAPGHAILSFGKRDDDKRAHSMIHFGKREDEQNADDEMKRGGHAILSFGKRDEDNDYYPDDIKRASHSMIHFGKRESEDESVPFFWNPAALDKEQGLYQYGKKTGPKNNHAMIHFGKRDEDKRSHAMIHFGKRSVEQNVMSRDENQTEISATKAVTRMKRDLEEIGSSPLVAMVPYGSEEEEDVPEEDFENALNRPAEIPVRLPYPDFEQSLMSLYRDYPPTMKKEVSKNMFLRFG